MSLDNLVIDLHNVNITDKDNKTPLNWAVKYGTTENMKLLLQHGAELDFTNKVITELDGARNTITIESMLDVAINLMNK